MLPSGLFPFILMVVQVTSDLAQCLQYFSKLQSIRLDGCLVTCSGMKAIGNWCASLTELSLSKCPGITDEGLSLIVQRHHQLRKLDITCSRKITQVSINSIAKSCPCLTTLRMESCSLVQSEAFVLIGQYCQSLEELDLTDNEIDDEGIFHIASNLPCVELKVVLDDLCYFICAGLKSIARCSGLSSLKLGLCLKITDDGVAHVGTGCRKLTVVDLYRFVNRNLFLAHLELTVERTCSSVHTCT